MNLLLSRFKEYLFSQIQTPSRVTVKNYLSDISHFIHWVEDKKGAEFNPVSITFEVIQAYKNENSQSLSSSSLERHLSSLRKFFKFLKDEDIVKTNIFEEAQAEKTAQIQDPFKLKDFKNFLFKSNSSHLTIKNYIIDVKQFLIWTRQVLNLASDEEVLSSINAKVIEEYKTRLTSDGGFSPATVNRKLSSLRRYITWASEENLVMGKNYLVPNISKAKQPIVIPNPVSLEIKSPKTPRAYSEFPPLRLVQKLGRGASLAFDLAFINPLAATASKGKERFWHFRGQPVFKKSDHSVVVKNITTRDLLGIRNISKKLYAPFQLSQPKGLLPKLIFHARFTRPKWYLKYHSYAIAHYINFAILVIFLAGIGFGIYDSFFAKPQQQSPALAALPTAPPRILSFQGRLTDVNDNPITASTLVRYAIYNDPSASGSALLWQEVNRANPDTDGIFNNILGNNDAIPSTLFSENASLYLGVTIESTPELTPRQQLATVAYAANSETLQGLQPITAGGAGTSNVVLALDSSGNLTIGGSANPSFTASGGTFKLSGQPLLLTTNTGTGSNVQVVPDGLGKIDLQKPLVNTSNSGNISTVPGSVQVNDEFSILATSSGRSVFTLNQDSTGPLISASTSGTARFTIDNSGNTTIAGNTTVQGTTGLTLSGSGADIAFTGGGNTDITSTGTLRLGAYTLTGAVTGNNQSITGLNNLSAAGTVTFNNFNANNNVLYATVSTGVLAGASTSTTGQCLLSGASAPSWGTCITTTQTNDAFWNQANGALFPNNSTVDFLIGGQSTTSALFSFTGVSSLSNQTRASISGQLIVMPNNGFGNVGIGTTTPRSQVEILKTAAGAVGPVLSLTNDGGSANDKAYINFYSGGSPSERGRLTFNVKSGGVGQFIFGNAPSGSITDRIIFDSAGEVGVGTTSPISQLHITRPLSYTAKGTALAVFDQIENQDIFTASASGTPRFSITSAGGIKLGTNEGNSGECLKSGGAGAAASYGSCGTGGGGDSFWNQLNGALFPNNSTVDFFVGGQSSTSAKFAVLNVNEARGGQVASISGDLVLDADGSLQTTNNQSLAIGGDTTGDITLIGNGADVLTIINDGAVGDTLYLSGGQVAVGGTTTTSLFNVGSSAQFQVDTNGNVSSSGTTGITLSGNGASLAFTGSSSGNSITTASNQNLTINPDGSGILNLNTSGTGATNIGTSTNTGAVSIGNSTGTFSLNSNTLDISTGGALTGAASYNGLVITANTGAITTGTWNATAIGAQYGGTGIDTSSSTGVPIISSGTWSVSSLLPIARGGTNASSIGSAGSLAYSTGSAYAFSAVGSSGQCLISGGSGSPTWTSCAAASNNWWTTSTDGKALTPINSTMDLLLGGTASSSAKFAFLNLAGGTPTFKAFDSTKTDSVNIYHDGTDGNVESSAGYLNLGSSGGNIYVDAALINDTANNNGNVYVNDDLQVSGNVAIGTTVPLTNLQVTSSASTSALLSTTSTNGDVSLGFSEVSGSSNQGVGIRLLYDGTNNELRFQEMSGPDILTLERGDLQVGIGTINPDSSLHVVGGVCVETSDSGCAATSGTVFAGAFHDVNNSTYYIDPAGGTSANLSGDVIINSGALRASGVLQAGGTTAVAYNRLGTTAVTLNSSISSSDDLLISGDLDVRTTASISGTLTLGGSSGIIRPATGDLSLQYKSGGNSWATALTVDDVTGNVGIGTTSPNGNLEISGSGGGTVLGSPSVLSVTANSSSPWGFSFRRSDVGVNSDIALYNGATAGSGEWDFAVGTGSGSYIYPLYFNKSKAVFFGGTTGGNVGIGIDAPVSQFHVTRPLTFGALGKALVTLDQIENQDILTASHSGVTKFILDRFGNATMSGSLRVVGQYLENTTEVGVHIGRNVGDNTPRILFSNGTAAQNWQIDNNSGTFRWYLPGVTHMSLTSTLLTLSGDLRLNGNDILDSSGTTRLSLGSTNNVTGNIDITGTIAAAGTGTALTLSGAATTAINITNTGVTTDISLQNGETISNDTDGTITITANILDISGNLDINTGQWIGLSASAAQINFVNAATDRIEFLLANVRVGSATPDVATGLEDLYVEGNLEVDGSSFRLDGITSNTNDRATLCVNSAGSGAVTSDTAGNNCDTSSRRFKHDINYLDFNGLDMVMQMQPASFIYNTAQPNDPNMVRLGFIAEDLVEINPYLGVYDDNGQVYSIFKYAIMSVLAKAIQEQQLEIVGNQNKITNLDKDLSLTTIGNLSIVQNNPDSYSVKRGDNTNVTRIATLSDAFVGNIRAGLVNAQKLTTGSLNVTAESVTIAGQSLRNYITAIVNDVLSSQDVVSPIASIDSLNTNVISPLSKNEESKVAVKLNDNQGKSKLEVQNASGSAVASFDSAGNATLSGNLAATSASIAGTLRAQKIIADQIEGLNVNTATLSANYITNNYYYATPSADPFPTLSASPSSGVGSLSFDTGEYINIATFSSQLAYVDNLNSQTAVFSQNLTSYGYTTLSDTSIVGQLAVNGTLVLADNSINVLGADLNLQPLKQGGISLMAGLIYIDTNGNAKFGNDVTIEGTLYANAISPIPGKDLRINLATGSSILASTSDGSQVLKIDELGNLIASGAGTFSRLNLGVAQPALADGNEFIATGSAGIASIGVGKKEITINNSIVTQNSLIYITPVGQSTQTPYLVRQETEESFTVGVPTTTLSEVKFNWLIIN